MSTNSQSSVASSMLFTVPKDDESELIPIRRSLSREKRKKINAYANKKSSVISTSNNSITKLVKTSSKLQRGVSPSVFTRKGTIKGYASLELQHYGFLDSQSSMGFWRKRYCVIKDGFFIWYKTKPSPGQNFSIHPSGFLPLTGCLVSPEGRDKTGYCYFQIEVPIVNKKYKYRTNDSTTVDTWINRLQEVSHVDFDIAKLGRIKMILQEEKTKFREEEKQKVLHEARQQARLVHEANQYRKELMESQLRNRKRNVKKFKDSDKRARLKSAEVKTLVERIYHTEEAISKEMELNNSLQGNLEEAVRGINQLTLFVLEHKGDQKLKSKLIGDLQKLRNMFVKPQESS